MELSWRIEEAHAKQLKIQTNPVNNHSEEVFPIEERRWNHMLACPYFKGHTREAEVSTLVMRLVRHYNQNERKTDGAAHWKSMCPKLRKAFQKTGGHIFSDSDWLHHVYKR